MLARLISDGGGQYYIGCHELRGLIFHLRVILQWNARLLGMQEDLSIYLSKVLSDYQVIIFLSYLCGLRLLRDRNFAIISLRQVEEFAEVEWRWSLGAILESFV